MQKKFQLNLIAGIFIFMVFQPGCKKDKVEENPYSWTEEFVHLDGLKLKQWLVFNNSIDAPGAAWQQGVYVGDKGGLIFGFKAYSTSGDPGEYAFAGQTNLSTTSIASSWLVTAPVIIKNGDKFSFYTRCDSNIIAPHTLEVRVSEAEFPTAGTGPADVGNFLQLLYTVNPGKTPDGYPLDWQKIEVTVSGLSGEVKGRIGFRYMSEGQLAGGIGIDKLEYISK